MPQVFLGALLLLAGLVSVWSTNRQPVVADHIPRPPQELIFSNLQFESSGQSKWGPVAGDLPTTAVSVAISDLVPAYFRTFNESVSINKKLSFGDIDFAGFDIFSWSPPVQFGGRFDLGVAGGVDLSVEVTDMETGTIDVDYPIEAKLFIPQADTVRRGESFTIGSSFQLLNGAALGTTPLGATFSMGAELNASATANGQICFFDCESLDIFDVLGGDSLDLDMSTPGLKTSGRVPVGPKALAAALIRIADGTANTKDLQVDEWLGGIFKEVLGETAGAIAYQDLKDAALALGQAKLENELKGTILGNFDGHVGVPTVNTTSKVQPDGRSLSATGEDARFVDVDIDLDGMFVETKPPLSGEVDLRISTAPSFGKATYTIADATTTTQMTQKEQYEFDPTPRVSLKFSIPVEYDVQGCGSALYPFDNVTCSGTSETVVFNLGDSVEIIYPDGANVHQVEVTPTFLLPNRISNTTKVDYSQRLTLTAGDFDITVPGKTLLPAETLAEICDPTGLFDDCYTIRFPGLSTPKIALSPSAPLYRETFFAPTQTTPNLAFLDPWTLGGIGTIPGATFTLDAEVDPTAVINGPSNLVEAQEGTFDCLSSVEIDFGETTTCTWDFGDGFRGFGDTVAHTYADNGVYSVELTVVDGHLQPGTATKQVTVGNLPPVLFSGVDKTVNEGDLVGLDLDLFGKNLVVNGDAEDGSNGWASSTVSKLAAQAYGDPAQAIADSGAETVNDLRTPDNFLLFGDNLLTNPNAEFPLSDASSTWVTTGQFSRKNYGNLTPDVLNIFDRNLVRNGDAERLAYDCFPSDTSCPVGAILTDWNVTQGELAVQRYGQPGHWPTKNQTPDASAAGLHFFYGDNAPSTIATQNINISAAAPYIDTNWVSIRVEAWLGGYSTQRDRALLFVGMLDDLGLSIPQGSSTLFGPFPAARANKTALEQTLPHQKAVKPATRSLDVSMIFSRDAGLINDAYVDNVKVWLTLDDRARFIYLRFPANGEGTSFFYGGNSAVATATQEIDVSGAASLFDTINVPFTLEGDLGGMGFQDDNAVLSATFIKADGTSTTKSLASKTAAQRSNRTGLSLQALNSSAPIGTRKIVVELMMTREGGKRNDGYADKLSFRLHTPAGFKLAGIPVGNGYPQTSSPGPADRGTSFFHGDGVNQTATDSTQLLDVSAASGYIDAGLVTYDLSGYLGGYGNVPDDAQFSTLFKDGLLDTSVQVGTATIGPVTNTDRLGMTGFVEDVTTGVVPPGTRGILLNLVSTQTTNTFSRFDGYADNLSLVLNAKPGAVLNDPGVLDTHTATVDWDDGPIIDPAPLNQAAGSATVISSHVYGDNGVYAVYMTVKDDDHDSVGNGFDDDGFTVTVLNVPPVVTPIDQIFLVGKSETKFVATYTDPGFLDNHEATIDWGDGSSVDGPFGVAGGLVEGTHTYNVAGPYPQTRPITVTVIDDDGDSTAVEATATIVDLEVPITGARSNEPQDEGSAAAFDGSFDAVPGESLTYEFRWDFGDGTNSDGPQAVSAGALPTLDHTYREDGQYAATLFLTGFTAGGALPTAGASRTVLVQVDNVAPVVEAGNNQSASEGDSVSLDPAAFSDLGVEDRHTASVDWGDGSPSEPGDLNQASGTVNASHRYTEGGIYTIIVTVDDADGGSGSDTFEVTVANQPPSVEAGNNQTVTEGDLVMLDPATFNDPGADDTHTATIDWNDGTVEAGNVDQLGETVEGSHVYGDDGTYTVEVCVTDNDNATTCDTLTVKVENAVPQFSAGSDTTAQEGQVVSLPPATFTDAGPGDTHTATVDWGDGTGTENGSVDQANDAVAGSHVYANDDTYTVEVCVTDDLVTTCDSFEVVVRNVPVEILALQLASVSPVVFEGDSVDLNVDFNDRGTLDAHTATVDWGDGSSQEAGVVTESPSGPPGDVAGTDGTVEGAHAYADNGSYTVEVCISDDDSTTCDTATVVVRNVAPLVNAGDNQSANEGDLISLPPATFADPGFDFPDTPSVETFTASVDWGDGTAEPEADISIIVVPGSAGVPTTGTVHAEHAYGDNGAYTVEVCVVDDDDGDVAIGDGTGCASFTVAVGNIEPTLDGGPDREWVEGVPFTLNPVSFDDHGFDAPTTFEDFTATIAWGDGTSQPQSDIGVAEFPGGEGVQTEGTIYAVHDYADDGVYTIEVCISDDDGLPQCATSDVTILNVDPVVEAGNDQVVVKGDLVMLDPATFTDLGEDTHTATVDWGDSSPVEDGDVVEGPAPDIGVEGTVSGEHVYRSVGDFIVSVAICDDDGNCTADTFAVTVDYALGSCPAEGVSPSAFVHHSATLGEGVIICDGATVERNAEIEDRSIIGENVYVGTNSGIGEEVIIEMGTTLARGVMLGTGVNVERDTILGRYVLVDDGSVVGLGNVWGKEATVGANARLGWDVSIGRNVTAGDDFTVHDGAQIEDYVDLGDNVIVGPNAFVEESAEIGSGAAIGDDAHIGYSAEVGENVRLGAGMVLGRDAEVGDNVVIGNGAVMDMFSFVGADSSIGPNVTVGESSGTGERVSIAAGVQIGELVITGDNVAIGAGTTIAMRVWIEIGVTIGNGVTIDEQADIRRGSTIGENTSIGVDVTIGRRVEVGTNAVIKDDATISNDAVLGDGVVVGEKTRIKKDTTVGAGTTISRDGNIGKNVQIGTGVTIGDDVRIRNNAVVPDGTVIPDDATYS